MSFQNLLLVVEERARERNHEVITAVLKNTYGRILWHLKSRVQRIVKVNNRITNKTRAWRRSRNEQCTLDQLEILKKDLTKQIKDDRLHLTNLVPCEMCPACTPLAMKVVLNPNDFTPIFIAVGVK